MTTRTIAIPRGREALEKAYVNARSSLIRAGMETKRIAENMTEAAIAGGTAYLYGVLEDKLPNNGKIPGTEIGFDVALGAAMVVGGAVMKQTKMTGAIQAIGLGLLLPALRDYGRAATFF